MIFNIQRFSTHDGDGIRTLIFYKGCPLKCQWCSNPESQSFGRSILYDLRSCKHFGDCVNTMPDAISHSAGGVLHIQRERISDAQQLKDLCVAKALTISGEPLGVDEIMAEIDKDLPFYHRDGGVTLTGGEPLAQDAELVLLLQVLHERRINTNMETSLHVSWELAERCIGLIDAFLVDLKHTDPGKFRAFTGGDARLVMENLEKLACFGAHVVVRIPVIPGFNHSTEEIRSMVDFLRNIRGIKEIHFLPYHTFGVEKYKMLGMEYLYNNHKQVGEEELMPYVHYAESKGFITKIGG
ncbi:MAG: glycyl-radical enzyme activating protein [Bacteroidales bacterium]|nr:glycyl-radical enzyme activating protein [Bacteroidales bacterium]